MSNTVSDSGGYEGSQQALSLGRSGGGTFTYRYEMFGIPDQLIVRYDGRDLLNTGFVSGSRTGTVSIPSGNANALQIILATNDTGTAWNYTISEDGCADPDPFVLTVVGGDWADTDGDGDCDATGTILIAYKGGQNLLRVENAVAEYDESGLRVSSGTVYSAIRQLSGALFEGSFDLDFDTGKVTVRDDADDGNEHKLAAIDYGVAGLTLGPRGIVADIGPQLPDGLGGQVIGAGSFPDLTIGSNGLVLDRTSLTLPFGFSVGKKWGVKSANLQFDYDGTQDKLKVEGEFTIETPFKTIPTGRAYTVKTADGKPFVYGPDGVEGRIELSMKDLDFTESNGQKGTKFGKFGLSEIGAYLDFDSLEVGGKFNVSLPGFGKVKNPGVEASFGGVISPELALNSFSLKLSGQVPLGATGWFGQSVGIAAENLAPNDQKAAQWSVSGEVSYLPEFKLPLIGTEVGLLNISGTITGGADKWGASAQLKMLNLGSFSAVVNTGSIEYDVVKSTLTIAGTKSIMNGFIKTSDTFKAGFDPYFSVFSSGSATLGFPTNDVWGLKILSGKTFAGANYSISFTNDKNFANDFIAGWTTVSVPTFGFGGLQFKDQTIGLRFHFNDILSPQPVDSTDIGMLSGARIAAVSRVAFNDVGTLSAQSPGADFMVPLGAETVLFTVSWETPDPDAKLRLIAPDGTVYEEGDFAAAGIAVIGALSSETGRAAGAAGLPAGTWRLEVVSALDLGQIDYEAIAGEAAPELSLGTVARSAAGTVTITYTLDDPDSDATLALFATTDTPGTGGIMIASGLSEAQAGSFVWGATGVAPGLYTIYGVADDGGSAPVKAIAIGSVTVTGGTDLAVRIDPPPTVVRGQSFVLDVSVGNIGDGLSTGTEIRLELPQGVEFLGSSVAANVTGQVVEIAIGDLASTAERDVTLTLRAPDMLGAIELSAEVSSDVFEQDPTDNLDSNTVNVAASNLADLVVEHGALPSDITLRTPFEFTVTVRNEGLATAPGVTLREILPAEVTFLSAIGTKGSRGAVSAGTVTYNIGNLASGESATVTYRVMPDAAGDYVAVAEAQFAGGSVVERAVANNLAIAKIDAEPAPPGPADLSLVATVSNPSPDIGQTTNVTVSVNNGGPGTASAVTVSALLPAGLAFVSASALQGTYDATTGIWNVGNMRDGLTRQLNITARVEREGSLGLLAEVATSAEPDRDSTPGNGVIGEDDLALVAVARNNEAPAAAGERFAAVAGTPLLVAAAQGVLANDSDPDGDRLFARVTSGPANGALTLRADGSFQYVPSAGFSGTDTWRYAATDGTSSEEATVQLDVTTPPPSGGQPTRAGDLLLGTRAGDTFGGLGGADTIRGREGDDLLTGDSGGDLLIGGPGSDKLFGFTGSDTLLAGNHRDTLQGGGDNDSMDAGGDHDLAHGGPGSDTLIGSAGNDTLRGGDDPDRLDGGAGHDLLNGQTGRDTALGSAGNDTLRGAEGDDLLQGGQGNDLLDGGQGKDTLAGGAGADTMVGGSGSDVFRFNSPGDAGDLIGDFATGDDQIRISASGFGGGLEPGRLGIDRFTEDFPSAPWGQFIYAKDTGALSWDPDGGGAATATTIAIFANSPGIAAGDIVVFA